MRTQPFIDYLAEKIRQHMDRYEDLTVVLPSQRMVRQLTTRLSLSRPGEVFWLPKFQTLDHFVYDLAELQPADKLWQSLQLYTHYAAQMGKAKPAATNSAKSATPAAANSAADTPVRSYAEFMEWGSLLLSDFNQLDAQLAPIKEVLNYVSEEKRIAGMDFSLNEASQIQARYLHFFEQLYPIYESFTAQLLSEGVAYQGLAERVAVAKLREQAAAPKSFTIFAGFNAITEAEAELMRLMVKDGRAEVYWDADVAYFKQEPLQEAGHFLRHYAKDPHIGRHIREEEMSDGFHGQKLVVQGVPQWVGQAEMAAAYLSKWYREEQFTGKTAVVLNEESLLLPLLNVLPEIPGLSYNLSMGVPLSGTKAHAWVRVLCQGREEVERERETGEAKIGMETLSALWRSSFGRSALLQTSDEAVEKELSRLSADNRVFFTQAEWPSLIKNFKQVDQDLWQKTGDFWFDNTTAARAHGLKLSALLQQTAALEKEASDHEKEYVHLALEYFKNEAEVRALCEEVEMPFRVWSSQAQRDLSGLGMTYKGEPEALVQISGMLETRLLDFDRVILLSVNEGILPSDQYEASFLLDALKRHCHIPTLKERHAMQAYYFYRLLAFSDKVVCLYHQGEKREKSRFLWQIDYERADMKTENLSYPFPAVNQRETDLTEIRKNEAMMNSLQKWLQSGVSPSAINTYQACSLRFYYTYVLQMKDNSEFDNTLNPARKGTVVHKVMEDFFGSRQKRRLKKEDAEEFRNTYIERLNQALIDTFAELPCNTGVNGVERKKMELWLDYFASRLEQEVKNKESLWRGVAACETPLEIPFADTEFKLRGIADRIDLWGDGKRVVDYKTGSVKPEDLHLRDKDDLYNADYKYAAQLLLYAYMYWVKQGRKVGEFPQACVYSFPQLGNAYVSLNGAWVEETDEAQKVADIEEWIGAVLNEIMDESCVFKQNPNSCTYCDYADLCGF